MSTPDIKLWLSRFRLAEHASNEARRSRPLSSPDESLTRAFEMMAFAEESGILKPMEIPEEDRVMYRQRARLCEPYLPRTPR